MSKTFSIRKEVNFIPFARYETGDQTNCKLVAKYLDKVCLKPGEVFSFDELVGPRTTERGFVEGLAIVNGRFIPDLGGGICLAAGVIYNAALLLELEILERNPHSRIPFSNEGLDSMIWGGRSDLKIRNNKNYPIFFDFGYEVNSFILVVTHEEDELATIEVLKKDVIPFNREYISSEEHPHEKILLDGKEGGTVTVFVNGKKVSEDTYKPRNEVVTV